MTQTYKILSALLSYPEAPLQEAAGEIVAVLGTEKLVKGRNLKALTRLVDMVSSTDLVELQEAYVALFDTNRTLSLHLFEHIHGESRDRGQAMVDLAAHYAQHGLAIGTRELPDYLPLFLEFLSILPKGEAADLLAEVRHVLTALGERLNKRDSRYEAIFLALDQLSAAGKASATIELASRDEGEIDAATRDAQWEEAEVLFGPGTDGGPDGGPDGGGAGSCPKVEDILATMKATGPAEADRAKARD